MQLRTKMDKPRQTEIVALPRLSRRASSGSRCLLRKKERIGGAYPFFEDEAEECDKQKKKHQARENGPFLMRGNKGGNTGANQLCAERQVAVWLKRWFV